MEWTGLGDDFFPLSESSVGTRYSFLYTIVGRFGQSICS